MKVRKIASLGVNMHLFAPFMYYFPVFYMIMYVLAIAGCLAVRTHVSFLTIIVLSAMQYAGWNLELWRDAQNMAIFELFVLSAMFFAFEGKFGTRLMAIVFAMIMTNVLCIQFEIYESIRQSIISLLFLSACIITLKASYNTHKVRNYKQRISDDGHFWAREDGLIHGNKMVQ